MGELGVHRCSSGAEEQGLRTNQRRVILRLPLEVIDSWPRQL